MPINPNLLVQADMLQDYFVDKTTGNPLAGGIITFYQDNSRTTFKNVYYQVGSPGNYTFLPFPNPMTLTASGTMEDANGNDQIPFYYPFDENNENVVQTYYVTVYSANQDGSPGTLQFTRQNFPLTQSATPPSAETSTNKNYIINKEFWRNIGSLNATTLSASTLPNFFSATVAPSQHDGFSMPDIQFFKNANGASDTISFNTFVPPSSSPTFADQILVGDVTPEFYFNLNCSGTGMETSKYLQFPISFHVKSLSGAAVSITLQAMNVGGSANNQITVSVMQFLGTGLTPVTTTYETITLSNTWQKYVLNVILPSAHNVTTSSTGDDALYLQIGFPAGVTSNINLAMPSIYMGQIVPTNDFDTYDQIDAVINSPRTGDIRTSLNAFFPFGWTAANDGVISNGGSITPPTGIPVSRANVDAWPLFNLLWQNFNMTPALAPIFTSAGSPSSYGASAQADWAANKQIQLTAMLGRVIAGVSPVSTIQQAFTNTGNVLSIANTAFFGFGTPVMVSGASLPTGIVANTIYFAIPISGTTLSLATTQSNALNSIAITLSTNASGNIFLVLGASIGSSSNTLTIPNLPSHNHPGSTVPSVNGIGTSPPTPNAVGSNAGATNTLPLNIASQGSNIPVNNFQPTGYLNVFLKL